MNLDKWTWRKVFKYLDFYDQHNFIAICRVLNENIHITNLYNIPYLPNLRSRVSYDILCLYPNCTKLSIVNNTHIKRLPELPLKKLIAHGTNISDEDLPPTLVELNANYTNNIKNVYHLPLRVLYANESCVEDPLPLTLRKLCMINNQNIKDISHLSLKYLVSQRCRIYKFPSTLTELHTEDILEDISHIPLKILSIGNSKLIGNLPLSLEELYIYGNQHITDVSYLSLKKLRAGDGCGITNEGLPSSLIALDVSNNPKITNVENIPLLYLNASGNCGLKNKIPMTLRVFNAINNVKIHYQNIRNIFGEHYTDLLFLEKDSGWDMKKFGINLVTGSEYREIRSFSKFGDYDFDYYNFDYSKVDSYIPSGKLLILLYNKFKRRINIIHAELIDDYMVMIHLYIYL